MKASLAWGGSACWLLLVIGGMIGMERYAMTAGAAAPIGVAWPADTALQLSPELPTLLLFAHPKCPCTLATIQELRRIEARFPHSFVTSVIFTVPVDGGAEWQDTALMEQAAELYSANLVQDPGGELAARFSASTSGQVMIFDPSGALRYTGGVTASRGHEGGNRGRDAVEYFLAHGDGPAVSFPVFGCGLVLPRHEGEGAAEGRSS